ncbi:hypothetical protein ES705_42727 [subsurface metagenome]
MKPKGNTSVVSFSLDLETLIFLDEFREEKGGLTRSVAIRHFIQLGRTYSKVLEEQLAELATKTARALEKEAAAKKKTKAARGAKNAKK